MQSILYGVEQLRYHYKLLDASSKGAHERARDTLEVSEEWEYDPLPKMGVLTKFIDGKLIASSLGYFMPLLSCIGFMNKSG